MIFRLGSEKAEIKELFMWAVWMDTQREDSD
jgi:hypothetical protein